MAKLQWGAREVGGGQEGPWGRCREWEGGALQGEGWGAEYPRGGAAQNLTARDGERRRGQEAACRPPLAGRPQMGLRIWAGTVQGSAAAQEGSRMSLCVPTVGGHTRIWVRRSPRDTAAGEGAKRLPLGSFSREGRGVHRYRVQSLEVSLWKGQLRTVAGPFLVLKRATHWHGSAGPLAAPLVP